MALVLAFSTNKPHTDSTYVSNDSQN